LCAAWQGWFYAQVVTAQDTFKAMLRLAIAPGLRALGFKGSGQVYEPPDEQYWSLLGFQRSVASDRHEARFTINLSVAEKAGWAEARREHSYYPVKPNPNIHCGFEWYEAHRQPAAGAQGPLVRLSEKDWPDHLLEEVLDAIRTYALPAMRAQMTPPAP